MFDVVFVCLALALAASFVVSLWRGVRHIRSVRADASYHGWSSVIGGGDGDFGGGDSGGGDGGGGGGGD